MCGRYSITTPVEALNDLFRFDERPNLPPRWNVAPTQPVPVVRRRDAGRELVMLRWGLIPAWAKAASIGAQCINARAESIGTKPAFRDAFARRRCLVLADSFYEWEKRGKERQPWRIELADGSPFGFAGLWERWRNPAGEVIESCAIVTTDANRLLEPLHDRMPVILDPGSHEPWLDPAASAEALQSLLVPYPPERLRATRISSRINNVKNDDADCVAPLVEDAPRLL